MNTETTAAIAITPYLMFGGRCAEALEFYSSTLDAKIEMVMRFKDSPEPPPEGMLPPDFGEKIMHCSFSIRGATLMASDGCGEGEVFSGFSLSLSVTQGEAQTVFAALAEGGSVQMPLGETFWSPCFGMLTDRFGLKWMIIVPEEACKGQVNPAV